MSDTTTPTSPPEDNPEGFSKEQIAYLEANWQRPLLEITREVFANPTLTKQSLEYRQVKTYVATAHKPTDISAATIPAKKFELSNDIKATIREIYLELSGPMEIARVAFKNPALMPTSREVRATSIYCREIDPMYRKEEDAVDEVEYSPPRSVNHLIGKVNQYAIVYTPDGKKMMDPATTTPYQLKLLQALFTYMWTPLFKITAEKYLKRADRELFESTFVKNCWDKPDLLAEELDQFIDLAAITVDYTMIDRTVKKLDDRLQTLLNEAGSEKLILNMTEVELLTSVREKAIAAMKQKDSLRKSLTGERSKRIGAQQAANSSLHNLVTAWRSEVDRKKIIQMVEKEKRDPLRQEIERLSTIDSLRAEVFGLDKGDLLR